MDLNQRRPHVTVDRFSMVPRADIPRSTFIRTHNHKSTFDFNYLVPIHVDEVLPGDSFHGSVTIFARTATPLFPIMDSMRLTTYFFFVPSRLVWVHFVNMMGEQLNPADSISYTVPQLVSPVGGFAVNSIYDYFGLPTVGQLGGGNTFSVNSLPLRAYNLIYDQWFRDENLQNSLHNAIGGTTTGDGPDNLAWYALLKRNKAHDYFTSCLPWPLKGGVNANFLTGAAPVKGIAIPTATNATAGAPPASTELASFTNGVLSSPIGQTPSWGGGYVTLSTATSGYLRTNSGGTSAIPIVYADLSTTFGNTINALRTAVQTQRLLERDARGGTRYTEHILAHWGVVNPDFRLQRPEYIGGGETVINTSAIPQTSATGLTGGSSPLGALGATAIASDQHTFSYHATEHGYIIGIACGTADLTYQQGVRKLWTRLTRYDFYLPVFAFLGEQAVLQQEIYVTGNGASGDTVVFGYQERWAEYKHFPSLITGLFKSTSAGTIDPWHLAEKFTSAPTLNSAFITYNTPYSRAASAGNAANGMQILFDSVFKVKTTRAMPMFSVPGNLDRF